MEEWEPVLSKEKQKNLECVGFNPNPPPSSETQHRPRPISTHKNGQAVIA
jgi:hypothetical protein